MVSQFSVKNFFFHSAKKFLLEPFCASEKNLVMKNLMHERGSGLLRFCFGSCLSHITEKLFKGTLPGSKECLVWKFFIHMRKEAISKFSLVIAIIKYAGWGWDPNPYLPLQNRVILPTVPWEPLDFLGNVIENIKMFGTTDTRSWTYWLRTLLP